eukprot:4424861-Pyramimonas_sp.AAC.1
MLGACRRTTGASPAVVAGEAGVPWPESEGWRGGGWRERWPRFEQGHAIGLGGRRPLRAVARAEV